MPSVETGQMSAVEIGQMNAAETPVLPQQKTSALSQCCPQLLLAAAGCPRLTQTRKSQDFDNFLVEKLKDSCSSPFVLQLYEELLKVTSILTVF